MKCNSQRIQDTAPISRHEHSDNPTLFGVEANRAEVLDIVVQRDSGTAGAMVSVTHLQNCRVRVMMTTALDGLALSVLRT